MRYKRLLKEINKYEDFRTGLSWRDKYSEEELQFIYECFELYEKAGGYNFRLNEVWLMKQFIEDWYNWKTNEQVKKLLTLIRGKGIKNA